MSIAYRPSHADATYDMKYGVRSVQVSPSWLHQKFYAFCCHKNVYLKVAFIDRVVVDLQQEKRLEELHLEPLLKRSSRNIQGQRYL